MTTVTTRHRPARLAAREALRRLKAPSSTPWVGGPTGLNWDNFGRVELKASRAIPGQDTGRGLWATRGFRRNQVITAFTGRWFDHPDEADVSPSPYDMTVRRRVLRGLRDPRRVLGDVEGRLLTAGSFANDGRSRWPANAHGRVVDARTVPVECGGATVFLVAAAVIHPGEEVYWSYGPEYWSYWDPVED